jgi:NTP pyrophosphatase (non-canonical NTP hydrolase)
MAAKTSRNSMTVCITFSTKNRLRCEAPNGFNQKLESWSLSDWMTATAGELGEAANIIKKLNRVRDGIPGNAETPEQLRTMLADELADIAIYLDLLAQAAGFDLETIRDEKFAKTSAKIGYTQTKCIFVNNKRNIIDSDRISYGDLLRLARLTGKNPKRELIVTRSREAGPRYRVHPGDEFAIDGGERFSVGYREQPMATQ